MKLEKYLIAIAVMGLAASPVWANVSDTEEGKANKEAAQQFDQLDQNGDGVLSQEEVSGSPALAGADVGSIDSDGDQQISFSEFVEHQNGAAGGAGSAGGSGGAGAGASMGGETDSTS